MKLIDADALEKRFEAKIGEWRGSGPLPSMEYLMWIAAKDMIDDAPTIDAIPVEWLRGLMNILATGDANGQGQALFLSHVITEWENGQKEQEARS